MELIVYTGYAKYLRVLIRKPTLLFFTLWGICLFLRIYNDRHYLNDVVAGACIGVLSTKLAYWLYPKIFKKSECYKEHVAIVTLPYYSAKEVGLNMCICF